ncbi:MAG TPA: Gfo/Idh/MocA family oxidoreductase [Alphaproteobacteria bacterium]
MLDLAIIGLGGWGRRLVQSVQGKSDSVRFRAAVVARPDRSRAFAEEHGLALGDDIGAAVSDPGVAGVVSSGPANLHAAHSLVALKAGKPVLAVKPMALRLKDAETLKAAADKAGVTLCMGYNRCFFPNVAELRRRLAAGDLGRLLHTEGDFCVHRYGGVKPGGWKADPANAPTGALADHMLYLTIDTLGCVESVYAVGLNQASDNELADTSAVLLRCANNTSGLLTGCGMTPDYYRFTVFGTEGWAEIRGSRQFTFQPREGEREEKSLPAVDAERAEVEAFAAAITGERPFPVSPEDAVHGVAVIEAMARSAAEGRPLPVPRGDGA